MKKNLLAILTIILLSSFFVKAQPTLEWARCYGGSSAEFGYAVIATSDSGLIYNGGAASTDGDVTGLHVSGLGQFDMWVVKTDAMGNIEWNKCLGSFSSDGGTTIQQTSDGGYIAAGESTNDGGDVTGNHNGNDYWVVKLDAAGNLQWQKSLGGYGLDNARSIILSGNAYVVAGVAASYDGDVTGQHGNGTTGDFWIVKLDSAGGIVWQKAYGGTANEIAHCIIPTADNGYMVAGETYSNDSDVTFNHGWVDCWLVKLDSMGNMQWQKTYGGSDGEVAFSIMQLLDGNYIMAGATESVDGDVASTHGLGDYWLVKLDAAGNIIWEKTYGGSNNEICHTVITDTDGGFLLGGYTLSNDSQVTGWQGSWDYWVIKTDSAGNLIWQKTLGGSSGDYNSCSQVISKTFDGGLVITGGSYSIDGDVTGNNGNIDVWTVKLGNTTGMIMPENKIIMDIYPNPVLNTLTIGLAGNTDVFKLELIDMQARVLVDNLLVKDQIIKLNISHLKQGFYFIKAISKNGIDKSSINKFSNLFQTRILYSFKEYNIL